MLLVIANQSSDWCGNPHFLIERYGFSRQCEHWLRMTSTVRILQQARIFMSSYVIISRKNCQQTGIL